MAKWRERFAQWMQGRYGGDDSLNRFLMVLFFLIILIATLTRTYSLDILAFPVLIYEYFRIFSRNIEKRKAENQKYLQITQPVRRWVRSILPGKNADKTHKIFSCPVCGQKVRVPKGRGKIEITCPKCSKQFCKRS